MTTFKCPYCKRNHKVTPKWERLYKDYIDFTEGAIHNTLSKRVVVCNGYDWNFPENTEDYPGDEYEYVVGTMENLELSEYRWEYGHGDSGGWVKVPDSDKDFTRLIGISPYTIVAVKKK